MDIPPLAEWMFGALQAASRGDGAATAAISAHVRAHGLRVLESLALRAAEMAAVGDDGGDEGAFLCLCGLRLAFRLDDPAAVRAVDAADHTQLIYALAQFLACGGPLQPCASLAGELLLTVAERDEGVWWKRAVRDRLLAVAAASPPASPAGVRALTLLRRAARWLFHAAREKPVVARTHADKFTSASVRGDLARIAAAAGAALTALPPGGDPAAPPPADALRLRAAAQSVRALRFAAAVDLPLEALLEADSVGRWMDALCRRAADGSWSAEASEAVDALFKFAADAVAQRFAARLNFAVSERTLLAALVLLRVPLSEGWVLAAPATPPPQPPPLLSTAASSRVIAYLSALVTELDRAQNGFLAEAAEGETPELLAALEVRCGELVERFTLGQVTARVMHALIAGPLQRPRDFINAWLFEAEENLSDFVGSSVRTDSRMAAKQLVEALLATFPDAAARAIMAEFVAAFSAQSLVLREACYQVLMCVADVEEGADGSERLVVSEQQLLQLLEQDVAVFPDVDAERSPERLLLACALCEVIDHWAFPLQVLPEHADAALKCVVRLMQVSNDMVRLHSGRALRSLVEKANFRPEIMAPLLEMIVSYLCAMVFSIRSNLARLETLSTLVAVLNAMSGHAARFMQDIARSLSYLWFSTDGETLVRANILRALHRIVRSLGALPEAGDLAFEYVVHCFEDVAAAPASSGASHVYVGDGIQLLLDALDHIGPESASFAPLQRFVVTMLPLALELCRTGCETSNGVYHLYIRAVRVSFLLPLHSAEVLAGELLPAELLEDMARLFVTGTAGDAEGSLPSCGESLDLVLIEMLRLLDLLLLRYPMMLQALRQCWFAALRAVQVQSPCVARPVEYELALAALWNRLLTLASPRDPSSAALYGPLLESPALISLYNHFRSQLLAVERMRVLRSSKFAMDAEESVTLRRRFSFALAQTMNLCLQATERPEFSLALLDPVPTLNALIRLEDSIMRIVLTRACDAGRIVHAFRQSSAADPALSFDYFSYLDGSIERFVLLVRQQAAAPAPSSPVASVPARVASSLPGSPVATPRSLVLSSSRATAVSPPSIEDLEALSSSLNALQIARSSASSL